ncbi:hypothetical protein DFH06DRAFT_1143458 [Mycena polygramma]|nr:hypothetical protein DFH06DRAFT_1143458 [Mycena polygramma]
MGDHIARLDDHHQSSNCRLRCTENLGMKSKGIVPAGCWILEGNGAAACMPVNYREVVRFMLEVRQTTDVKGGQDRIRWLSRTFARDRSQTGKLGISHLANTTGRLRVWDCLAFGCEKNRREEKGVVNDPDRSRSWAKPRTGGGRRSTEGQRPKVVRTEEVGPERSDRRQTGGERNRIEVTVKPIEVKGKTSEQVDLNPESRRSKEASAHDRKHGIMLIIQLRYKDVTSCLNNTEKHSEGLQIGRVSRVGRLSRIDRNRRRNHRRWRELAALFTLSRIKASNLPLRHICRSIVKSSSPVIHTTLVDLAAGTGNDALEDIGALGYCLPETLARPELGSLGTFNTGQEQPRLGVEPPRPQDLKQECTLDIEGRV